METDTLRMASMATITLERSLIALFITGVHIPYLSSFLSGFQFSFLGHRVVHYVIILFNSPYCVVAGHLLVFFSYEVICHLSFFANSFARRHKDALMQAPSNLAQETIASTTTHSTAVPTQWQKATTTTTTRPLPGPGHGKLDHTDLQAVRGFTNKQRAHLLKGELLVFPQPAWTDDMLS